MGPRFFVAQVRPARFAAQGSLRASVPPCPRSACGRPLRPSRGRVGSGVTNPVHPGPPTRRTTINSVCLIGRLTANTTIHAGEQHESATFRLAAPRPASDSADFVDIVTFDKLAATCGEYLTKGREVAIVGKLRLNEWTTKDGERRSRLQVVADAVQFLDAPKTDNGPAEPADKPADPPAVGAYRRKAS
jgi:single-strand DNA-binding protein